MNTEPTLILLVDDNRGDARLLKELLREPDVPFALIHAETLGEALERLESERFEVIFLDLSLPDASGLDTVIRARAHAQATPIIVLTGLDDETLRLKAVQAGAQDYLVKGSVDGNVLWRTIRYAVERHRLALELERTQRAQLEMKDQFLSHLSHELRSPLTTIYQFLTILTDGLAGELNAEQREYLDIVTRNVNQLRNMISDLLDVTRAGSGKLAVVSRCASVVTIIAETVQSLQATAAEKQITLTRADMEWVPPVMADPDRIRQVLTNLIENALKFTPRDGHIDVRAWVQDDSHFVNVSVTDSGIGISDEGIHRIFDRLYQEHTAIESSRKGLGIGLYLCRELVSRHGGQIWAESRPGQGSKFTFTLPIASPAEMLRTIEQDGELQECLGAIRLRFDRIEGATTLSEAARRQAITLIDRLLESDRDVLLPRITSCRESEEMLVVSRAPQGELHELAATLEALSSVRQDLIEMGISISACCASVVIPESEYEAPDMTTALLRQASHQDVHTDRLDPIAVQKSA